MMKVMKDKARVLHEERAISTGVVELVPVKGEFYYRLIKESL
jgi:hypothetical protein